MIGKQAFGALLLATTLARLSLAAGAAEPAWKAEILRKLERRVTFATHAKSPSLAVLLADLTGCKFTRDKTFPRRAEPVVFARNLPARTALRWLCALSDGGWMLRDGAVVLCSAEAEWQARKHPIRRYGIRRAAPRRTDAAALRAFVQRFIGPPRGHVGGRATLGPDATLIVAAPQADHQTVAKLVETLNTLGPNQSVRWQVPGRPIPPPGPPQPARGKPADGIRRKLKEKVSFDFVDVPLHDILAGFAKEHDISFVVDMASRPDPAKPATVTLKVTEMELSQALRWVARVGDLYDVQTNDAVVLTSETRAREWNEGRAAATLHIHDFTTILAEGWTVDEVVAFMREGMFLPGQQAEREDQLVAIGNRVILWPRQPPSAEWAVKWMRRPKVAPDPVAATEERHEAPAIPEWEALIRKALQKRVTIDIDGAPVGDVMSWLSTAADLILVLDLEGVEAGLARRTCILHLRDAPVRAAVDSLCLMTGLSWRLKEEAVFLSSPERCADPFLQRLYGAERIVRTPAAARSLARLMELLVRKAGGPGLPGTPSLTSRGDLVFTPVKPVYVARPGYLLHVVEAPAEQELVTAFYGALRELKPGQRRALPDLPGPGGRRGLVASLFAEKLPAAVARRLEEIADFDLVDVPMHKAVAQVATRARATLILDPNTKLLETKITLRAKRLRLADALKRIEKQAGATHLPLKHGLLITTPAEARKLRPAPCVLYDARDVCPDERSAARLAVELEGLGKKSEHWADGHFVLQWQRRLVVRTAPAMHTKVREFLIRWAGRRGAAK